MAQIVYVDEYEPSRASIRIGDPVYRRSDASERLVVGAPINAAPIIVGLGLIATAYLIYREMKKG